MTNEDFFFLRVHLAIEHFYQGMPRREPTQGFDEILQL